MAKILYTEPLTAEAFAPYGDVLEAKGASDTIINEGICGRFDDLARMEFLDAGSEQGRVGISLFRSETVSVPYDLKFMERHPLGSQAFIPMNPAPFLVMVADDDNGVPKNIKAFLTAPYQGINYHRHIWHGALAPLAEPSIFSVIDRIGEGKNLDIYRFERPYQIQINQA